MYSHYGLGYTASNHYFQMNINSLMFFYAYIFGLPAAVVGTIFIISRF